MRAIRHLKCLLIIGSISVNLVSALPIPVAYWDFEESQGTQILDKSGNGHNGAITGTPTWTSGVQGTCLNFNGSMHVEIPASSAFQSGSFTISTWIMKTIQSANQAPLLEFSRPGYLSGVQLWSYTANFTDGAPGAIFTNLRPVPPNGTNNFSFITSGGLLPIDTWNHIVLTFDSSSHRGRIYVDGVLRFDTSLVAGQSPSRLGSLYLGWRSPQSLDGSAQVTFLGKMDETRFYSVSLSAFQIDSMYKATLALNPPTLVARWDFDEGTGTTLHDRTGNGHDGVIVGPATWATEGTRGGALYFNGSTHVEIPASSAFSSAHSFTLSAWVWQDAENADMPVMEFGQVRSYAGVHVWVNAVPPSIVPGNVFANLRYADSSLSYGNANGFQTAGSVAPVGKWNHVVLTYDSAAHIGNIFLNASLLATKTIAANQPPSTKGSFFLGWRPTTSLDSRKGATFTGRMDEVRVYSKALNAQEISSLYTTYAPPSGIGRLPEKKMKPQLERVGKTSIILRGLGLGAADVEALTLQGRKMAGWKISEGQSMDISSVIASGNRNLTLLRIRTAGNATAILGIPPFVE